MKNKRTIGFSFLLGAVLVFIPYTLLTINFDYPDILRIETGAILQRFQEGGSSLILTWLAFAWVGLPLLAGILLLGKNLEQDYAWARVATVAGTIGIIVQLIGLLRWVFVVPVLASAYINAEQESTRQAAELAFRAVHQYGGVVLGEHIGQLFTIAWTVMATFFLAKSGLIGRALTTLGYSASAIYLMAQAELLATVLPDFPVWELAGFLGSTLWLLWLILVGVRFLRA